MTDCFEPSTARARFVVLVFWLYIFGSSLSSKLVFFTSLDGPIYGPRGQGPKNGTRQEEAV